MNFYSWIKSFTLSERKKKQFKKFSEMKRFFESLNEDKLLFEYVNTKALFEHRSKIFSFFLATILLSVLTGLWKEVYSILLKCIELTTSGKYIEQAQITLIVFCGVFAIVCFTILAVFIFYLNSIYRLNKKKILLEKVIEANE
jgi:hypothetical protein